VIIDDGVSVSMHAIFRRNLIVLNLIRRQDNAYSHVAVVVIRRAMFSHNVFVKPRPRVDAKYAGDTASHTADHSPNGRADRAGCRITRSGAPPP